MKKVVIIVIAFVLVFIFFEYFTQQLLGCGYPREYGKPPCSMQRDQIQCERDVQQQAFETSFKSFFCKLVIKPSFII